MHKLRGPVCVSCAIEPTKKENDSREERGEIKKRLVEFPTRVLSVFTVRQLAKH